MFGHRDPPISVQLPLVEERQIDRRTILSSPYPEHINVDFSGYFQYHTKYYAPWKDYFQSLFEPVPAIKSFMDEGVRRLRSMGKTVIGLHLRRGDYVEYQDDEIYGKVWFVAQHQWYLDILEIIWGRLQDPVLFIASDDLDSVLPDFSDYTPVTANDLLPTLPKASFYPDHYLLSQCDVLAISNSSYSFSASMLNRRGTLFLRPYLEAECLYPYDPWDSPVNPWLYLLGL